MLFAGHFQMLPAIPANLKIGVPRDVVGDYAQLWVVFCFLSESTTPT